MGQDNYKIYSSALAGSSASCEFFFQTHIILLCLIKYFIKKRNSFLLCICFILPTILKTIFPKIIYLFMYNIYTLASHQLMDLHNLSQRWKRWVSLEEQQTKKPPKLGLPWWSNGNPLQCSCLENPVVRGAWQATAHNVAESDLTEAT